MSKLMNALLGMMPSSAKEKKCPDCGMPMQANGCCSDCGYGEEDSMDGEDDKAEAQALLDLRDTLQLAIKQIDRLIVDAGSEDDKEEESMPSQQIVWVRQHSK